MTTIVLLNCSISLFANSNNSSTGERDSVLISYSDLKIVNSKLVELDYTKQINSKLKTIIANDSITISSYKTINDELIKSCKTYKKQRNISFVTAVAAIVGLLVSLIK